MKNHWRRLIALLPEKAGRKFYENYFKREHNHWIKTGSSLPVSNLSKQKTLQLFQQKFNINTFVETGTYFGDTLYFLYPYFSHLFSIELSTLFYSNAKRRFKNFPNIKLLQGDSGEVLKELVPRLNSTTIFWLDGHYSGGLTAKGDKECPVFEELHSIFLSPFHHLIFIDDARLFIGQNDYPTAEEIKNYVQYQKPDYTVTIENDCIRLLPPV